MQLFRILICAGLLASVSQAQDIPSISTTVNGVKIEHADQTAYYPKNELYYQFNSDNVLEVWENGRTHGVILGVDLDTDSLNISGTEVTTVAAAEAALEPIIFAASGGASSGPESDPIATPLANTAQATADVNTAGVAALVAEQTTQDTAIAANAAAITSATHDAVTLGAGSDSSLALTGQALTLTLPSAIADNTAARHDLVTLGAGSDPALALAGQELTLTLPNVTSGITVADTIADANHTQDFATFGQTWNDVGSLDFNLTNGLFDVNVSNTALPGTSSVLNVGLGSITATATNTLPNSVSGELTVNGNLASLSGDTGGVGGPVGFAIDNSGVVEILGEAQTIIETNAVSKGTATVGQILSLSTLSGEVEFIDGGGDNLGNHLATQTLDLDGFEITDFAETHRFDPTATVTINADDYGGTLRLTHPTGPITVTLNDTAANAFSGGVYVINASSQTATFVDGSITATGDTELAPGEHAIVKISTDTAYIANLNSKLAVTSTPIDASAAAVVETLPAATSGALLHYVLANKDNAATLAVQPGESINGVTDGTFPFSDFEVGDQFRVDSPAPGQWFAARVNSSPETFGTVASQEIGTLKQVPNIKEDGVAKVNQDYVDEGLLPLVNGYTLTDGATNNPKFALMFPSFVNGNDLVVPSTFNASFVRNLGTTGSYAAASFMSLQNDATAPNNLRLRTNSSAGGNVVNATHSMFTNTGNAGTQGTVILTGDAETRPANFAMQFCLVLDSYSKSLFVDPDLVPTEFVQVGTPINAGSARQYVLQWDGSKIVNTLSKETWTSGTQQFEMDHLSGYLTIVGRSTVTSSGSITFGESFASDLFSFSWIGDTLDDERCILTETGRTVNSLSFTNFDEVGTGDGGTVVTWQARGLK